MKVRAALIDQELDGDREPPPLVVAWPLTNNPRQLTAELARAVSAAVGGLPVVLIARAGRGEIQTRGTPEATQTVIRIGDLDRIGWVTLRVPDQASATRRPRRIRANRVAESVRVSH
jgi:hypothetical protein